MMHTTLAVLSDFGDAVDFVFNTREAQTGGVQVGGLHQVWEFTWEHLKLSGAAIGMQQTALSVAGLAAPVVFAALVSVSGWQLAYGVAALFPLAGWALLGPLAGR